MSAKIKNKIFLSSFSVAAITTSSVTTSCVYPGKFQTIDITDSNIFFSKNNWLLTKNTNGHNVMTTYPGGAYIKVAFYGNTIGIDTYCASSFPKRITLSCYIDGSTKPIVKSLSDALGNILIFADNLKERTDNLPHTAKICIQVIKDENTSQNRFSWPDQIIIQNILIEKDKTLVDPKTVIDPTNPNLKFEHTHNVLVYGDDYIAVENVGSDFESNARLWEQYDYEYSLVGWTGSYVTKQNGNIYAPQFYDSSEPLSTKTLWNQFNESSSRLGSDNKFLQKPDLIILNIGANDALNGTNEEDIKNVLSEWATYIMETMYAGDSQPPKILIEMPYLFDSSNYESYRTSYKEMYRTLYEEKGWAKTNLFLLDLSNAANLVIYYQSSDKIHPNIWGYDSLVKGMEIAMVPTNPKNVAFTSDSSSITVNWSNQMSWYDIESVITSYEMEYKLHIDDNWNNPIEKIPYSPIEQPTYTFSSLASGNYDIRIRAINELPINQPIYSEYSVVENIEVPA